MVQVEELEFATLGGGCFWCLEPVFDKVQGVEKVESGYAGGKLDNPTYEEVCTGTTGHAEVVQIKFNPKIISYEEILEIFFGIHDPTQLNRQGNDIGSQYRSIILYHSSEQQEKAEQMITAIQNKSKNSIVTEVKQFQSFFRAEEYHQKYYQNNPTVPYCNFVITPKLSKFRLSFGHKLKS
ncbi:MAG: peptide-methionine (S)-S-oxide reductase MsrA [Candidatus Heimdallarchaeota archaeon]|nr:MAG: peptide-methionine (S)-S-oxide reductase MsrA [Candidatus Heimdallarchaeota archaeon]